MIKDKVYIPLSLFFLTFVAVFSIACSQDSSVEIQTSIATTEATTDSTAEATADSTAEATAEPVERVLKVAIPGDLLSETSTKILFEEIFLHKLYVGLTRFDPAGRLWPQMIVAIPSIENEGISTDGLTYTFLLNRDLKWSNEEPITAQQILDTLISYDSVKEERPQLLELFSKIDLTQSTVIDDRTLVIKLRKSSPEFLTLSSLLPFFPVRSGSTDEGTFFLSNGPFQIDYWSNNRISLIPNEVWEDPIGNISAHEIERLEFVGFESFTEAKEALSNGEIDVLNLTVSQALEILTVPSGSAISVKPRHITYGVFVNSQSLPFSAVESRQALALGLDKQQLLGSLSDEIQRGYISTDSWIPPGIFGNDNSAGVALSASEELVTDYWARGLKSRVVSIELLYSSENSLHVELATELQKLWEEKLPVQVILRSEQAEEYFADLKTGNYEFAIGGWQADYRHASNWLLPFASDSDNNFLSLTDEKYNAFLENNEYADAHNYLIEQSVVIPMLNPVSLALVRSESVEPLSTMFDFQGAWTFD